MKYVPDDLRDKLIEEAKKEIRENGCSFSIRDEEICEAAFWRARKKWKEMGYVDKPTKTTSLKQREKDFLNKILPPIEEGN